MSTNPLDGLAPFPKSEDEATAKSMARHLTVHAAGEYIKAREVGRAAFALYKGDGMSPAEAQEYGQALSRYAETLGNLAGWFAAAFLLRSAREHLDPGPDVTADGIAKDLWRFLGDEGLDVGEFLFDWLVEDGHNPNVIEEAAGRAAGTVAEAAA